MRKSKTSARISQASPEYMQWIETNAMQLRAHAQVNGLDRLDPHACSSKLNLKFVELESIAKLPPTLLVMLQSVDARNWSGISRKLPNGELLLAINPNMTPERINVTIMEEAAHRANAL